MPTAVPTRAEPRGVTTPAFLRICAVAAPLLLFGYGVLRLLDGLDGDRGPGLAWNLGHTLFLVAFVLLGTLVVGLRRPLAGGSAATRRIATAATVVGLAGVACFLWVIVGDLSEAFHDAAPLPEVLQAVGPLLFQAGVLTLLGQWVLARRLPAWSPLLVLVGFLLFAVNLDLIPVGAALILAGLLPLGIGRAPAAIRTTNGSAG